MISDKFQCAFIHIPKTGGTSIEQAIWPNPATRTAEELWGPDKAIKGALQHLSAKDVRDRIGIDKFDKLFKFTVVRNPWDKAVSQYIYTTQQRPDLRRLLKIDANADFEVYLEAIANTETTHPHWMPQHLFINDGDKPIVDYIGRFELFESTHDDIMSRIGIDKKMLRLNPSKRMKDYRYYYSKRCVDLVNKIYSKDIEQFEYRFNKPIFV